MAYEERHSLPYTFEVRVHAMNGQSFQFFMDKFAMIGDVKQRLSAQLVRKFHEMKLVYDSNEPDMFDKVSNYRNSRGVVELTLVMNRICRWCNVPLNENELGDFCGTPCYAIMQRELQDPESLFVLFGVSADIGLSTSLHYAEPWEHQAY